jgi:uncharacterized protein YecT (DUF1311 family)
MAAMKLPVRWAGAAIFAAVAVSFLPVARAGIADDPEVKALKEKVEAAENQTNLNLTSKELCDLLDARMKTLEGEIRKKLEGEAIALFDKSAAAWREYRTAQVKLEGSFYAGGSIQPLVHNQAYSALTETHIDELTKFKDESLEEN